MTNNTHFRNKVGLFVAIGLLVFASTIILLGENSNIFFSSYTIKAKFADAHGIANGSVVSLSGIKIGNVSEVSLDPKSKSLIVEMKLQRKYQPRITKDSEAQLKTQGALGDKYIYIVPGTPSQEPIPEDEFIENTTNDDWMTALSSDDGGFSKASLLIEEVHKLALTLNQGKKITQILANLASASEKMGQSASNFNQISQTLSKSNTADQLATSSRELTSILKKINSGQGTLGLLINDPIIHERLKELLGDSQRNKHLKSLVRKAIKTNEEQK